MFLFLRLLLGHLIGDFPFQTDETYKRKIHGFGGQVFHAFVAGLTLLLLAWPYLLNIEVWYLVLLLTVLHVVFDWMKTNVINRCLPIFWAFVLDQALHIGSLLLVLFLDFSRRPSDIQQPFLLLYNNDKFIMLLIGYFLASFTGTYFLDTLKKNYFPAIAEKTIPRSINYFLFERIAITGVFCYARFYIWPLVLIFFFGRRLLKVNSSFADFLLNVFYAGIIGMAMKAVCF